MTNTNHADKIPVWQQYPPPPQSKYGKTLAKFGLYKIACKYYYPFYTTGVFRYMTAPIRKLPRIFLIGAYKSGTTSLYDMLQDHPQILKGHMKEPSLLSFFPQHPFMLSYRAFFPIRTKQGHAIDASTYSLPSLTAPYLIKKNIKDARCMVIFRNPIDMLYSFFWFTHKDHKYDTFEDALKADEHNTSPYDIPNLDTWKRRGHYADQLKTWIDAGYTLINSTEYNGKTNKTNSILVFDFSELRTNSKQVVKKCFDFLDLPQIEIKERKSNTTKQYPPMQTETLNQLREYYKPHNRNLAHLLGDRHFVDWDY